jgi:hypothetical protein
MTMKISSEAADKNRELINKLKEKWKQDEKADFKRVSGETKKSNGLLQRDPGRISGTIQDASPQHNKPSDL